MPALPITFACGLYDRMLALYTGDVKPEGIDLNFLSEQLRQSEASAAAQGNSEPVCPVYGQLQRLIVF